jgi:hypothetical protein
MAPLASRPEAILTPWLIGEMRSPLPVAGPTRTVVG